MIARLAGRWRDAVVGRLFPPPVDSVTRLAEFVGGRSAWVGQTALYGYLKTRMGTSFPKYFEDPAFAASIHAAAVRVVGVCAGDLTIYAVALAGDGGRLDPATAAALARRCFADAVAAGGAGDVDAATAAAFADRAERTLWPGALRGMATFAPSADAVIRFAPVSDGFKALDETVVKNSVRFRWLDVRERLARRIDAPSVCADWRGR